MNENLTITQQLKKRLELDDTNRNVIVFSDLDGTLLPAKMYRSTNNFADLLATSNNVITKLAQLNIPLVPVTGRSLNDLNRTLEFHGLNTLESPFSMHIYSAGRNIQFRDENGNWQEDLEYETHVMSKRELFCNALIPLYHDFEQTLQKSNIKVAHFIPRDQQPLDAPFRTYMYEGNIHTIDVVTETANDLISKYRLTGLRHSTSEVEVRTTKGKFAHSFQPLDKADAVNYVLKQISSLFPGSNIGGITVGNSGNDFSMLMEAGVYGCIVGDSTEELLAMLRKFSTTVRNPYIVYRSNYGLRNIYHGKGIGPKTILEIIENMIHS